MKSFIHLSILVALLVGATVLSVYAQNAGSTNAGAPELKLLSAIFTGAIGKSVGLLVAFVGVYTAVAKGQGGFGITLIILGVLIAFLPGVFNGVRKITCPIAGALAGNGSVSCVGTSGGSSGEDYSGMQ